jgi:hypothetical protein
MKKYEYKFFTHDLGGHYTSTESALNEFGAQGWKLFTSYKIYDNSVVFVFKRQINKRS